jgi:hypothetical protein
MSAQDPDIEVMLDALGLNIARYSMARRVMHTIQDHNPELCRHEGIIGMVVGVLGFVPPDAHDKFSAPVQKISAAWGDFCASSAAGRPPYALSPGLTRILKAMSIIELEDVLNKPEPNDATEMNTRYWDIVSVMHKIEKRIPYYGDSEFLSMDIAHDDIILQLEARKDTLMMRLNATTGPQQKPPQP